MVADKKSAACVAEQTIGEGGIFVSPPPSHTKGKGWEREEERPAKNSGSVDKQWLKTVMGLEIER